MLHERAMTDALTGLPNRAAWMAELARGVARAHRAGVPAAVMFLDLDGFKQVNDRYGHAAGDALLCGFARRLRNCLRRSDFIARLAGDEFVVLLDGVTHPEVSPQAMAGRVMRAMEAPLHVDGQALQVTPSIGVAVQKSPGLDAARLMQKADEAMYAAKRSPRSGCVVVEC
jgi:diguanylate cyclase (GGDEF)-like protein